MPVSWLRWAPSGSRAVHRRWSRSSRLIADAPRRESTQYQPDRRRLQICERDAGTGGDLAGRRVDGSRSRNPGQRQGERAVIGDGAGDRRCCRLAARRITRRCGTRPASRPPRPRSPGARPRPSRRESAGSSRRGTRRRCRGRRARVVRRRCRQYRSRDRKSTTVAIDDIMPSWCRRQGSSRKNLTALCTTLSTSRAAMWI